MNTFNSIEKNTLRECKEILKKNPKDKIARHRISIIARKHCYTTEELIEMIVKKEDEKKS